MKDERIKEEYNNWQNTDTTEGEESFYEQSKSCYQDQALGFYGGFKTAERLAKIEVLEEMKRRLRPIIETDTKTDYWAGYQHAGYTFESMIENKIDEING